MSRRDALKILGTRSRGRRLWFEPGRHGRMPAPPQLPAAAAAPALGWELPKLGYTYDALEPHIDAKTMEVHYSKHHAEAYINNAKALPPRITADLLAAGPVALVRDLNSDTPESIPHRHPQQRRRPREPHFFLADSHTGRLALRSLGEGGPAGRCAREELRLARRVQESCSPTRRRSASAAAGVWLERSRRTASLLIHLDDRTRHSPLDGRSG